VHRDGDAEGLDPFPTVCINGLRTRPSVVIAPSSRCRVLGIRLSPLGACALLRESIDGLLDVTIDVHAALGRDAHRLAERCADAADVSLWNADRNARAIIDTAVEWLVTRLHADHQIDPLLHYAIEEIRGTRGAVALDSIASQLGLSRTRFAQRFRSRFGVTPKRFARIVRFHHALTALDALGSVSQAAAELDYYDQAHMYRDFAEFAGMTPGAFLSATRYPGSASVAEP
jgi:AraC-like DNA-binding protein